ncbi:PREDICTED: fatty acid hydroxylase domain-containing protein 2-like, partial [Acropora digitifera]|uniref:fatty acid hydroxylase domain-containing protein 2-like n=1 Tax=Acropora digitifera TaxID=70779 RepID=UPI00077A6658
NPERHVERFWGASGDFWQSRWKEIHALCGGDEFMLTVIGTNVVTFFVFWIFGALYLFVDLTGRPKWVLQYKIQDGSHQRPVSWRFLLLISTQNYGMLGVLDRLHGTDVMFRNSRAYDRHIMLLGLIPLKQTFPDDTKKGVPVKRD